ncbi:HNH endonuclease [Agrobacterium pusense]|uniref:HNH endonuclease n=1 Tax=Agrobacterium pusense TaxID=648995 RepID=UPI003C79B501
MPALRNDSRAQTMAALYSSGKSLSQVAAIFGVTRQSVHKMLARRQIVMRRSDPRPSLMWRGVKYTLRDHGYFASTVGNRSYLHRDMWEAEYGPIPPGYDVHHIDEDKTNNALSNFELHSQSEHGRRHGFGGNQYTGSLGRRPVKW